jgi:D-sedoheptulose 7-phosphate isomerase
VVRLAGAGDGAGAGGRVTQSVAFDRFLEARAEASQQFFDAEAEAIALLCRELSDRFLRGGRLLAVGDSPQTWSDAHHVAVEFVHPVIVGKRALPALAVNRAELSLIAGNEDAIVEFEPLRFTIGPRQWTFRTPTRDPFVRQELCETLYHVVWELVHVFFEHGGASKAGAGASEFLYPFLHERTHSLEDVVEDVRRSVLMKSDEVVALRRQTLSEGLTELLAAAADLRRSFDAGGTVLAFGNGGSATDAMDVVADFRAAPQGWPARRALDLTSDAAILTALANDIGTDVLFQRQVIAYSRPGDVVLALSTSGNSANVILALEEAQRRGLRSVAMVGYDGGRVATDQLADQVVVTRSEHIPRIQEAQASAYHALRELVETAVPEP